MDVWLARDPAHATPLPAATAVAGAELSTSSKHSGSLETLRDGRWGPQSESRQTPRFVVEGENGGSVWIQCQWPEPRELERAAVYWAVDRRSQVYWGKRIRGVDLALPRTWRVLYRQGGEWRSVKAGNPHADPNADPHADPNADRFTLRLDLPNEVRFKPVKTDTLRLEMELAGSPCAVQEWWVE